MYRVLCEAAGLTSKCQARLRRSAPNKEAAFASPLRRFAAIPPYIKKGLTCRVDHRSYERQGIDLLPAIHEGVAVRQMEAKGITTDKGDINRWVKKTRNLLRDIRKKIAA